MADAWLAGRLVVGQSAYGRITRDGKLDPAIGSARIIISKGSIHEDPAGRRSGIPFLIPRGEDFGYTHQALSNPEGSQPGIYSRRRRPMPGNRTRPGSGLQVHRQGEPGRGGEQRDGGARPGQYRRPRGEARHGRQRGAVQAVRRYRRFRHRTGHRKSRRDHPHLPVAGTHLRRHQPGRHQGAGVLLHRRTMQEDHEDSGLPRRSARHRHHLGRRPDQRAGDREEEDRGCAGGLPRGGRQRDFLRGALRQPGCSQREHRHVRHQGRDLRRPHGGHEPV